jgi:two-component sensor histidine kinase
MGNSNGSARGRLRSDTLRGIMITPVLSLPWVLGFFRKTSRIAGDPIDHPRAPIRWWRSWGGPAIAVVAGAAGVIFDASTPDIISVSEFYLGLVLAGFWFPNRKAVPALALLATLLIIAGRWITIPDDISAWEAWLNRALAVGTAWGAALFVWYIRGLHQKLRLQIQITNTLSRELNHRVANNLQLVSSFLNLQAVHSGNEEVRRALALAGSRVMVIARIQRLLSHSTSSEMIESRTFITEIVREVRSVLPDAKQVEIVTSVDSTELETTSAIMLGALLLEFINNALKHAFPSGMKGKLTVTFVVSNDRYIVECEDDGVGIGQERVPNGFGTQSIADIARLMEASITCQPARPSDARPGTKWRLSVPHGKQSRGLAA